MIGPLLLTTAGVLALATGYAGFTTWRARRHLAELAFLRAHSHDAVTGLPIRALWESEACARLQAEPDTTGLLVLDIDQFKEFNTFHCHEGGDAVLREIAIVLGRTFHDRNPLLTRLGGDEFGVLLSNPHLQDADTAQTAIRATDIKLPDGTVETVTVTAGLALCRDLPTPELKTALAAADRAACKAKQLRFSGPWHDAA